MECRRCGYRNPDDAIYCGRCGNRISVPSMSDQTTTYLGVVEDETEELAEVEAPGDLRRGQVALVIRKGPDAGMRFTLDKPFITIGRHPESDIFLDDITVSRRHAEIRKEGEGYVIEDKGSLNGTYLNRERIDLAPLRDGDEIQVGKFRMLFFQGG
jgi:hypothetical protein